MDDQMRRTLQRRSSDRPPHLARSDEPSRRIRRPVHRTQTGCRTCRHRKVKCDEKKPECDQCRKGRRTCSWQRPDDMGKRSRLFKRPNSTACDTCREKKLKCIGDVQNPCTRCRNLGIECVRSQHGPATGVSQTRNPVHHSLDVRETAAAISPTLLSARSNVSGSDMGRPITLSAQRPEAEPPDVLIPSPDAPSGSEPPGKLPRGSELQDLSADFFADFGFFTFIHQLHFNRLLAKGKVPRELTLMVIASAMRFAAKVTPENMQRADAWVDTAIAMLLPRIYQGFDAIQLMALLLAQHYDLNRGNFTSAWLLGANCTRMMQMMSLQTFDRTYPAKFASKLRSSPLLSDEALRRLAWSTFYADSIVDGGRYGFHTVDEKAYRLQLPCDQIAFLGDETVVTEPLFATPAELAQRSSQTYERGPLDMSAYLLRTASARRRALHFAFRASHKEQTVEQLSAELAVLETDIEDVITALPRRFHFNADNMFLHHDRLITFIVLHVFRHNLFIILGRAALLIYQRDPAKAELIPQVRRNRISHALPIAGLISEGLKNNISFDPQIGVQAYVALEILLFEPRRLADIDSSIDPKAPELMDAIPYLLTVIRNLAERSEFVKQLHVEAVHRLLRCDCRHLLNQADLAAFQSEYALVGQEDAEYDFRDFRWAKLERLRRGSRIPANAAASDEALLEYRVGRETTTNSAAPSPRLDAMDVHNALTHSSTAQSLPSMPSSMVDLPEAQSTDEGGLTLPGQPWWGVPGCENADHTSSFDWSWLLDETGHAGYQTGDPDMFWSQLGQI